MDWADLYRAVFPDLVRYLHRKVWDEERAHELAQEVFVRALREEPERPRAWLFTVAANLARDEIRTVVRRKKHLTLLKGEMETQTVGNDPDSVLERSQRNLDVRAALESLSERDREILLLWDAGFGYGEIAEQTGLAPGAIGTTLARARRRLVEAYQGREESDVAHP
ncbi:MAG: sigma-70 family RNA polymerase sigma factor [Gemmatimonadota bacterium]